MVNWMPLCRVDGTRSGSRKRTRTRLEYDPTNAMMSYKFIGLVNKEAVSLAADEIAVVVAIYCSRE